MPYKRVLNTIGEKMKAKAKTALAFAVNDTILPGEKPNLKVRSVK
ncbi:hypothetical protein [Bacillus xiapuensis]|nr:hypothetical protein [Bacillus xiapuensis]